MVDFEDYYFTADDGLQLHARVYGERAPEPPVICLPGLSRNCRDFDPLATRLLNAGRRVIAFDYRGRGLSCWDAKIENYNIVREAKDVLIGMESLEIGWADFIGTSRGGLILHILGSLAPPKIRRMVLNDIGPVIEAEGLKHISQYLSVRQDFASLDAAARHLKSVHSAKFPVVANEGWLAMAKSLYREKEGRFTPDFDPAIAKLLEGLNFDRMFPDLWQQFDALATFPILVVRGENSDLLSTATVAEMASRHASMQVLTARRQGHAPFLELEPVASEVIRFLSAA